MYNNLFVTYSAAFQIITSKTKYNIYTDLILHCNLLNVLISLVFLWLAVSVSDLVY